MSARFILISAAKANGSSAIRPQASELLEFVRARAVLEPRPPRRPPAAACSPAPVSRQPFARWFDAEGFVEVEPAALQTLARQRDRICTAFATEPRSAPTASRRAAYLHTSPEFAMKKLLAAGETQIFAPARVFRNRERTALHAPEFTMLEWYRVGAPLTALMQDCAALLALAAEVAGAERLEFRGREARPIRAARAGDRPRRLPAPYRRRSLRQSAAWGRAGCGLPCRQAQAVGVRVAADDTWSDLFSRLLSERVEPHLGIGRPTLLTDYPTSEAALAQAGPGRSAHRRALRALCLRRRARQRLRRVDRRRRAAPPLRRRHGGATARSTATAYPIDEDFLAAARRNAGRLGRGARLRPPRHAGRQAPIASRRSNGPPSSIWDRAHEPRSGADGEGPRGADRRLRIFLIPAGTGGDPVRDLRWRRRARRDADRQRQVAALSASADRPRRPDAGRLAADRADA